MKMKLFESILNNVIQESMGEAIVNPNDTSKDVFTVKSFDFKGDVRIKITVPVDGEDVKKVEAMIANGQLDDKILRQNQLTVVIPGNDVNDPNSEGYQKIIQLCQLVSQLGKYGQINPEEVVREAQATEKNAVTSERKAEATQSEDDLWDEFVKKFDDPRIQTLLQSFHAYMPVGALDDRYSDRNIGRILSQDAKRIAAGKPPATFVYKPQDWRTLNRRIKSDAIPFYLIYHNKGDEPSNDAYEIHTDKSLGADKQRIIGQQKAKDWAKGLEQAGGRKLGPWRNADNGARRVANKASGYGWDVYYDVADTEPIPGLEDLWNDPEREGLVDNIRWVPTKASMGKAASDSDMSPEEFQAAMGGIDTKFTMAAHNALKRVCAFITAGEDLGDKVIAIRNRKGLPMKEDGSVDMEKVKEEIFDMSTAFAAKELLHYANPKTRIPRAQMVACMYVGAHRIDPDKAIEIFRGLDKEAISAKADDVRFSYKTVYNKLATSVKTTIETDQSKAAQAKPKKAMEENFNYDNVQQEQTVMDGDVMQKSRKQFYNAIDNFMGNLGIEKDGQDEDDMNMSPEEMMMNEAKFYSLLNKMNKSRF